MKERNMSAYVTLWDEGRKGGEQGRSDALEESSDF